MLTFLRTLTAVLPTALRRLGANLGLALCALVALVAAVALSISIPVYAEGASLRLLQSEIVRQEQQTGRSPFVLLFQYVGSWSRPLEWDRVQPADAYITGPGVEGLGLPLNGIARHVRTDQMKLFFPPSSGEQNQFLTNVTLGFMTGMDPYITIVDGKLPRPSTDPLPRTGPSSGKPVDAMIMRALADQIGVNVGDEFRLVATTGGAVASIPIRITALWEPTNPRDPAWFFQPDTLLNVVLIPEATFTGPVAAVLRNEVGQVVWFVRMNGTGLTASQAAPLLAQVESVRAQAAGSVQGLRLMQSPEDALGRYRAGVAMLIRQLFVFSIPILGLVIYFTTLVASLLVNRQRGEIALLKTRGVRDAQIMGIYVVEWSILGVIAMLIGPPLGLGFALFMGRTQSFLQLATSSPDLSLVLTPESLSYGGAAVGLAIFASLVPAFAASRRTLVDEQQQAARTLRPPLWQRFYLDILLLVPPAYGIYQLRTTGGLWQGQAAQGTDPFSNPLLIMVPVLLCFGFGLLAVRLVPTLLELLARLAALPTWTAPLVALRSLARQPVAYRGPLLLLILTLSLAAFSASMAATLDGALYATITYRVGAATQLIETGQSTERQQGAQQPGSNQSEQPERKNIEEEARFLFVPVDDHLQVKGIQAVARVGRYEANVQLGGVNRQAQLVGIDRLDFSQVIQHFSREWGSGESLGSLMNMLARTPEGVIVSENLLQNSGLKVGDTLPAQLAMYGDRREVKFVILAAVKLWPGFYPQDGPIMVANLEYIFDQMGGNYPYDVWITRDPQVQVESIVDEVRHLGITVVGTYDTAAIITEEQLKPQRQGLFGLLSVGFVAAGIITLLGFLISALITARRRAIELGVLSALGMSGWQVALAVIVEQVALITAGIGAGTGIGLLSAWLVVPLLQVGAGPYPDTPGYPPQIAWDAVTIIYAVFAVALLLTLLAMAGIMGRMQLFQAVKLGDVH